MEQPFLGIGLQNIAYASQVFPAILTVLFYSQVEKLFTRFSPKTDSHLLCSDDESSNHSSSGAIDF